MSSVTRIADSRTVRKAVAGKKLNRAEATELTARIRQAAGSLWQLVAEAHDRKAWQALGYSTWRDYAVEELQMSESRSYQLIDTGRVMRAIEEVAGSPDALAHIPVVTARDTQKIKSHLIHFKRELNQALNHDGMSLAEAVEEAVYALPSPEKTERVPRNRKVIEGELVDEQPTKGDAAAEELKRRLEDFYGDQKKNASQVTAPIFIPEGKSLCKSCGGHGFV